MIYIYAQREACDDRLVATLDQLDQVVPFVNLLDQYGYWPEGYEVVIFSKSTGLVYHYTDKLENTGRFDTRASFLVDKMPEVFFDITTSCGPASNAQEWWV